MGLVAAVTGLIYGPSTSNPLRLWDHHAILLLAKAPQFGADLFWRLFHFRIGFNEDMIYFRVLAMPLAWAIARLAGDHRALYYAIHLLLHLAVASVLYVLATEVSGDRTLALLTALLFTVYAGQGDVLNIPVYSFMLVSLALAGLGVLLFLRSLRGAGRWSLALGVASVAVGTLFYEASLLLAVALPLAALGVALARGPAARRDLPAALTLLAAVLLLLALVVVSVRLSPLSAGSGGGIGHSLQATILRAARGGRVLWAVFYGGWAVLSDVLVFVTGHAPAVWHRGNMPYWDLGSLEHVWWWAAAALTLMLAGLAGARRLPGAWRAIGLAAVAVGISVDPRTALLAALLALAVWPGARGVVGPEVLCLGGAALLVSFTIALGPPAGYNLIAFRHHYVTGFFVLAAGAAVFGANRNARPAWQRMLGLVALGVCVMLNAGVVLRILDNVRKDNEMVFSFDRALHTMAERHGPRSLFVAFPTSFVRGADWRGFPAQDIAFDLLHYGHDPMTRYLNRAPFVVLRDGLVRPNPVYRRPETPDFLFRFLLANVPRGRYEVFGSSPREPRIVLRGGTVSLVARRRSDGRPVEWRFGAPPGTPLPVLVAVSRAGRRLQVALNGRVIGSARVGDGDEYEGWESDDIALLGRGFEELLAHFAIWDTYMRIGSGVVDGP